MIVVKEEQSGEWPRPDPIVEGGDYDRPPLKEDQHPQSDLHNNNNNSSVTHNHNHGHHHNGPTPIGPGPAPSGNGAGGCPGSNNLCSGCGQRIFDRYYVLAVERQWHNNCLRCQHCGRILSDQLTCFARDGLILCKEDYYRAYQQVPRRACARCGNGIGSQELIMRAKDLVYHINCFVCVVCLRILNKGDHFGMRNAALYCQKHYEMVLDENSGSPPPSTLPPGSPHHLSHGNHPHHSPLPNHLHHPTTTFFNGAGSGQKGRPRKRKDPNPPPLGPVLDIGATTPPGMPHISQNLELLGDPNVHLSGPRLEGYESSSSTNCAGGIGQQRTKRMRTSFKHHQLRTMKSYFSINQNPDAKDLKQLAQKTGLSKRVLQVWFQNARAKWRRNMLRSESNKSGGTSPSREDELQINPNAMTPGALDILSTGGGSDDGGFSSDVY